MTQSNTKTPVVFCVGIALLCLFMFSLYLSGGMYARYATTASGSDGARVAKFDIEYTSTTITDWSQTVALDEMYPGSAETIEFSVTNKSEVAVCLQVVLTNQTGNLPIAQTPQIFNSSVIPPNTDTPTTVNYTISWPAELSDPAAAGKTDVFRLDVSVVQVD